jgi:lysosomal acid lipase/cholesteryl ester hydrolase
MFLVRLQDLTLLLLQMFAFLFRWTDANWLLRRKPKMFRFTPSPVPSAGIFWWTGLNGFSFRGCVLNEEVERWYEKSFPPLALYQ